MFRPPVFKGEIGGSSYCPQDCRACRVDTLIEIALIWLVTLLPIVISPGPANILYAASGSSFGIKKTVPFWLGTNFTSIFQTLAVGFGLDLVISTYPHVAETIRYMGIVFLLYLAAKFFSLSCSSKKTLRPLTFKDGVIVEALNMKYLLIPTIMFSQFYSPDTGGYGQIFLLTLALLCLTLTTSMIWIIGGNSLASFALNERRQKTEGFIFGSLLCATALWLIFM